MRTIPAMFDSIARRYDLLNRTLSCGCDLLWRRRLVRRAEKHSHSRVLDLATGTGDVALAIARRFSETRVTGVDPAGAMLAVAHEKIGQQHLAESITLVQGDALHLSFPDESFDMATIAFGIRNVPDVAAALHELERVLKPRGTLIILEFSLPSNSLLRRAYLMYFRHVLPVIGGIISGNRTAYTYLNQSVEAFPFGSAMCRIIETAGFTQAKSYPQTLGIATLYVAQKPRPTEGEGNRG